jgi:O-antigen ligase
MNPSTVEVPFELVPHSRRLPASTALKILILLCWLLSSVCINSGNGLDLGGSLGTFELLKAGTRVIALALLGMLILIGQGNRSSVPLWRLTPLALFALWTIASTIWSPLKTTSFTHGVELLLLTMLSMAVALVCREERATQRLLFHIAVIICLVCVAILALNVSLVRAGLRPALYMQPNNLAAVAASGLILICACRLLWNWPWTRVLFWPVMMICGTTMYVARSRSAYVAAGLILLPLWWRIGREWLVVGILCVGGALAALWPFSDSVSALPDSVTAYIMRGQSMDDAKTFSGRTELWSLAADVLHDAPMFGYGYYVLGATGKMYVWGAERRQTAHNLYLHVITGTGLIGFLLLVWALAFSLGPVWSAWRKMAPSDKIAKLVLQFSTWVAILGMLELSVVGPVDPMVLTFFVLLGLGAGWCCVQTEGVQVNANLAPA